MPKRAEKALTAKAVENLKPPNSGKIEVPDGVVPGLALRVSYTGIKSFILSMRVNGKLMRRSLGKFPEISLAEARTKAANLKDNPEELTKPPESPAPEEPAADTFGALAEKYIKRGMVVRSGPKSGQPLSRTWETEAIIRREILPRWGNRAVTSLTKKDATALTDAIIDRGAPQMANRVHGIYRRIFNWAVKRGEIEANPFAMMDLPAPKIMRDRVLAPEEIKAIWNACYPLGYPWGPFFRLLFLTAQREREVANMSWPELDIDNGIWIIPGHRTKNGVEHECPLSSLAIQEIKTVPRFTAGDFVFTTQFGRRAISGFSKAKMRLDRYSGVTGWRIHDIRRTVRTGLAELGVPEIVGEKCLNHVERNMLVKTYNRHAYLDEKRDALERWAGHVRDIVRPPPENVVRMEHG